MELIEGMWRVIKSASFPASCGAPRKERKERPGITCEGRRKGKAAAVPRCQNQTVRAPGACGWCGGGRGSVSGSHYSGHRVCRRGFALPAALIWPLLPVASSHWRGVANTGRGLATAIAADQCAVCLRVCRRADSGFALPSFFSSRKRPEG